VTILWRSIPLYRQFLLEEHWDAADVRSLMITWICIAAIQLAHWLSTAHIRYVRVPRVNLAGQLLLFLGRLNFGFVGAVFATVFYVKFPYVDVNLWRIAALVILLFTMFCYSLDLERLGRLFMDEYAAAQSDLV